jgi:hypothetical protein
VCSGVYCWFFAIHPSHLQMHTELSFCLIISRTLRLTRTLQFISRTIFTLSVPATFVRNIFLFDKCFAKHGQKQEHMSPESHLLSKCNLYFVFFRILGIEASIASFRSTGPPYPSGRRYGSYYIRDQHRIMSRTGIWPGIFSQAGRRRDNSIPI